MVHPVMVHMPTTTTFFFQFVFIWKSEIAFEMALILLTASGPAFTFIPEDCTNITTETFLSAVSFIRFIIAAVVLPSIAPRSTEASIITIPFSLFSHLILPNHTCVEESGLKIPFFSSSIFTCSLLYEYSLLNELKY